MMLYIKPLLWGGLALALSTGVMASEPDAAKLEKGETLFMTESVPACAVCHTLKKSGATGAIGPDLDATQPTYERVRAALRDGVGVMPAFAETLDEEALDAVAAFVVHATQN